MMACSAASVAADRRGAPAVPPSAPVESAPAAQPGAAARGSGRPWSKPAIKRALQQSPAPVVSTGVTGGTLTWTVAMCDELFEAHRSLLPTALLS